MKRLLIAGLALALLVPACALAQEAFTGTWKVDVRSMQGTGRPFIVHLKDGMFECNCVPPVKVKADGEDHAVAGHPGFDTVAVKILNDHSFQETDKKNGKVVGSQTFTVAADGKTGTYNYTNSGGTSPVNGELALERTAKGVAGSNATAGTWRFKTFDNMSANGLTSTYKVTGDEVNFSDPTGDSYDARMNGKAVPYIEGSGTTGTTVAVKRVGKDGLRETYYRNGKITSWDTMIVSADGKTMKINSHNLRMDRRMTMVANKQ